MISSINKNIIIHKNKNDHVYFNFKFLFCYSFVCLFLFFLGPWLYCNFTTLDPASCWEAPRCPVKTTKGGGQFLRCVYILLNVIHVFYMKYPVQRKQFSKQDVGKLREYSSRRGYLFGVLLFLLKRFCFEYKYWNGSDIRSQSSKSYHYICF